MIMSKLKCQNVLGLPQTTIFSNASPHVRLNVNTEANNLFKVSRFELSMILIQF